MCVNVCGTLTNPPPSGTPTPAADRAWHPNRALSSSPYGRGAAAAAVCQPAARAAARWRRCWRRCWRRRPGTWRSRRRPPAAPCTQRRAPNKAAPWRRWWQVWFPQPAVWDFPAGAPRRRRPRVHGFTAPQPPRTPCVQRRAKAAVWGQGSAGARVWQVSPRAVAARRHTRRTARRRSR